MKSIQILSQLFRLCFFLCCFLFLSCEKSQDRAPVLKAGESLWTFQELQDYFQLRLKDPLLKEQRSLKKLKEEILQEIFVKALIENWAKKNKIQQPSVSLNPVEQAKTPKPLQRALKAHKRYELFYRALLKNLEEGVPAPSLAEQRSFYKKNKNLFTEPASCHLKQIALPNKKIADDLQKKLRQGASFEKLRRIYSRQKSPGWIKKGGLEIFDRVCFEEKTTGLSPVMKSPYGYHIFFVGKKTSERKKPFKRAKSQILSFLKKQKAQEEFKKWLKRESLKTPLWTNKKLLENLHIQYKSRAI